MKEVEGYVEGEQVRSASLIVMIAIMILLFAVVFAVLGRGEYQPPSPEEHGSISQLA
jgi:flagellar basal body-associated protein FliL